MQLCPYATCENEDSGEIKVPRDPGAIPAHSTKVNLCAGTHLCQGEGGHATAVTAVRPTLITRPGTNTRDLKWYNSSMK